MFWDQHNSIQRLSSFIKGPLCRNWAPEKATLVLACTDRNYMHDNSVTPKLFHLVRHICCTDEISGNLWSRAPPHHKHGRKPKSIHVCLVIFSFRRRQYHYYISSKNNIITITRLILWYVILQEMKKRAYIQTYISFYRTALLGQSGIGIKGLKQVRQNLLFSWLPLVT